MAGDDGLTPGEQRLVEKFSSLEDRLLSDLLRQQQAISELTIKNLDQASEIEDLKTKIAQAEKEVKDLQESKNETKEENDSYVERIKVLEKRVETLEKDVETLHMENTNLRVCYGEIQKDVNNDPEARSQQLRIATEFSRLLRKYFAGILGSGNKEVGRMQYIGSLRLYEIKERVVSSLGGNEELKRIFQEKTDELPSNIFEPWFSDLLVSDKFPLLLCTSYRAVVTEINSSRHDEGVKEDALKVIDCLRDMYKKVEEPFGGIQSIQDQVASSSGSKRRTKSPARGANSQRKQAKTR